MNFSFFKSFCWKGSLLLLILISACKKTELPPPVEEDPVFSVSATLEGQQALDFVAGEDDYYMFTSFAKDDLDVFSFIGRFEKLSDCESNCKESLEFEIRDFNVNVEERINPDRSLSTGNYFLSTTDNTQIDTILEGYEVTFQNTTTANVPLRYSWNLGTAIPVDSFVPVTQFYPTSNLNQAVTLSVFETGGMGNCVSSKTQDIQFFGDPDPMCSLDFSSQSDTVMNTFCAQMSGVAPYTFKWDVLFDSIYFTPCLDDFDLFDSLNIVLTGTDAQGCVRSRDIFVQKNFNGPMSFCSADFNYDVQPRIKLISNPVPDSLSLSKAIIRYTDREGLLYSSENATQAIEDRFEILESSDYLENENGEKTRQLKVRFSGVLLSEGGTELRVDKGEGTIVVAYPE